MTRRPGMRTIRRGLSVARGELRRVGELRPDADLHGAMAARARAVLELDGVDVVELAAAKSELRSLRVEAQQSRDEIGLT